MRRCSLGHTPAAAGELGWRRVQRQARRLIRRQVHSPLPSLRTASTMRVKLSRARPTL